MTAKVLTDQLVTDRADPKKMAVDGSSAENYSMQEQIDRVRFVASDAAGRSRRRGLSLIHI